MKKKHIGANYTLLLSEFKRIRRVMKLTLSILLISISSVFATNINSQTARVNINAVNVVAKEILVQIEEQTDYLFVYNYENVDLSEKISVKASNTPVAEILAKMFENTNVIYAMEGNNILLMKRSESLERTQNQRTISGTVVDQRGEPIIGANIIIKGTTTGIITDINGHFSLAVPPNATIEVTYVGFLKQEIPTGNQSHFSITLQEDFLKLEEVVVVGYGTQRKTDVTGALSVVSSDDLLSGPSFNALQGLKGKASGVNIFTNTGNPLGINESAQRVVIRGMNSINTSTNPLYVVDGVQMDDIQFVNPNDIDHIEVLKDASATAIYGARGANGVILVTTKRGALNEVGVLVSYESWVSLGTLSKNVDVMNAREFLEMSDRAFANIGKYQQGRTYLESMGLTEMFVDRSDPLIFDKDGNPLYDTNWQEEATRKAWSHSHQLNIQQQNNKSSLGAFINYTDQQGILLNNYAKRISGRFALDANPLSWLDISTNAMVNHMWGNGIDDTGGGLTARRTIWEMLPILPVKFPDGSWSSSQFKGNKLNLAQEAMTNPVHELTERKRERFRTKIFGNLAFIFHLADGLDLRTQIGVDANIRKNKDYTPNNMINISVRGAAGVSHTENYYWQEETYLNYNKVLKDIHRINGMLGMSWSKYVSSTTNTGTVQDFDNNYFGADNLGAGKTPSAPTSSMTKWQMNSYFARASYSFKDRYLTTVTLRADGSSRFGKNNKYAFFPSVGLGWVMSSESFMENINWLSYLKLRTSYGRTGNTEISPYSSLATITSGTYLLNGDRVAINQLTRMPNPDLKWEKTDQYDVGFDLKLFNNKINLEIDYYYKKTSDLLLERPLPFTTGYSSVMDNIGRVDNSGIDFLLSTTNIETNKFGWESTINLNYNRNKIKKLGENDEDILTNPSFLGGNVILRVGEPMGSFYGYRRYGTWGTDEAAEAAKVNAVPGEAKRSTEREIIGNGMPKWTGSFINKFHYDNWDLTVDLQFVTGVDTWQLHYHTAEDRTGYINGLNSILYDSWTESKQNTMVQQIRHRVYAGHNTTADSRWVSDGSYLRGNLIQLGYTFDKRLLNRWKVKSLRLNFSVNNAFLIHAKGFSGYDPEGSSNTDRFGQNIFFYQYPTSRTYSLGVKLSF